MRRELTPMYDNHKSFYGKAIVFEIGSTIKELYSYGTLVAVMQVDAYCEKHVFVTGTYSPTTLRHIKEFLKQEGFRADSKKQIEADYMEVK